MLGSKRGSVTYSSSSYINAYSDPLMCEIAVEIECQLWRSIQLSGVGVPQTSRQGLCSWTVFFDNCNIPSETLGPVFLAVTVRHVFNLFGLFCGSSSQHIRCLSFCYKNTLSLSILGKA